MVDNKGMVGVASAGIDTFFNCKQVFEFMDCILFGLDKYFIDSYSVLDFVVYYLAIVSTS